jgi:hypothetical protein
MFPKDEQRERTLIINVKTEWLSMPRNLKVSERS